MKKYIALLRGVNVGGKNKVSMALLKKAFEDTGFTDVQSYINSGNIIFCAEETDVNLLSAKTIEIVKNSFNLDIPAMVISAEELAAAMHSVPKWWGNTAEEHHDAVFVIPPISPAEVIEAVKLQTSVYEKREVHGKVIFWSAPLAVWSKTRLAKLVSSPFSSMLTIRNANTTRKLHALANDIK